MTSVPNETAAAHPDRRRKLTELLPREVWASLAITVMWIAVAVSAVWGPDFVGSSNDGNHTTIPSGIFVALFASIGTWAVAKYALGRGREEQ